MIVTVRPSLKPGDMEYPPAPHVQFTVASRMYIIMEVRYMDLIPIVPDPWDARDSEHEVWWVEFSSQKTEKGI
jgi:hypothetical protein